MKKEVDIEYNCIYIDARFIKMNEQLGVEISCKIEARIKANGEPEIDYHCICEIPNFILQPDASVDAQIDAFLNALENKYGAPIKRKYLEYQCKYLDDYEWEI